MASPSNKDWGEIHAKAWRDPKFRELLEKDPTAAVKQYASETGKNYDRIVTVGDKPGGVPDHELHEHEEATIPPACC
jgi:hypothetical protein